jgi:hypothetical protein
MLVVLCRFFGITASPSDIGDLSRCWLSCVGRRSSNTKEPTQDSQHLLRSPISEGEAVIPKSLHRTTNIY